MLSENAGGLVGDLLGDIEGSWFAGDVSSSAGNAGGLAGNAVNGAVRTSWASAEVEAALGRGRFGGDFDGVISDWKIRGRSACRVRLIRRIGGRLDRRWNVASANVLRSFWDISASGLEERDGEAGEGVNSLAICCQGRISTTPSPIISSIRDE